MISKTSVVPVINWLLDLISKVEIKNPDSVLDSDRDPQKTIHQRFKEILEKRSIL